MQLRVSFRTLNPLILLSSSVLGCLAAIYTLYCMYQILCKIIYGTAAHVPYINIVLIVPSQLLLPV